MENKIDNLKSQVEYLQKRNNILVRENAELRSMIYGKKFSTHIHEQAQRIINSFLSVNMDTKCRGSRYTKAREYYYYFLRTHTNMSLKEISRTLHVAPDHSTVIHALKQFDWHCTAEKGYKDDYRELEKIILSGENNEMAA